MRNSCQTAIQIADVRILNTSVFTRPAHGRRRDFMKTVVGQQRRNVFCPDSSKKSQFSTSNSEEPGISIRRLPALYRQIPLPWRQCGKTGAARKRKEIPPEATWEVAATFEPRQQRRSDADAWHQTPEGSPITRLFPQSSCRGKSQYRPSLVQDCLFWSCRRPWPSIAY